MRPATVLRGNALALPLAGDTVDLIVTSPPYFGLRSYQDAGEHYAGQIGAEATPAEFVDALVAATREMVRVLKPSGSIFVNLGDKYSGVQGQTQTGVNGRKHMTDTAATWRQTNPKNTGVPAKSLIGVPWRYALRCIDTTGGVPVHVVRQMFDDVESGLLTFDEARELVAAYDYGGGSAGLGLILRAEVIWSKPNGLPESVTDRVRRSHETWFHFTRSPRYYSAVDEIREAYLPSSGGRDQSTYGTQRERTIVGGGPRSISEPNPLGKLPGSVWTIPTQPLKVPAHLGIDHFAAFPMEWPRRIIRGWSPAGVCVECGEGRRPVRGYNQEPEYRYVEDRRISEKVTIAWCSAFADWCETRGVRRKELDIAAGTADMGGWWASRLPHRCAVPTPEQHASLAQVWPDMPSHPGDALWETYERRIAWSYHSHSDDALRGLHRADPVARKVGVTITGYACACPEPTAPTTPAVVLDPFGGTGTTALVAKALGRHGISVDMSADYCRLAQWRTTDPGELARAMQVDKPAVQVEGQISMLELDFGEA
jgi:DNA modification methylase